MKKAAPPLTLDKVKSAFSQWRASRNGQKKRIPQPLWDQIKTLTHSYKPSLIRKTLGISGSQYSEHIPRSKSCHTFVEVPVKSLAIKNNRRQQTSTEKSSIDVEIYRLDGSHLCMKNLDNNTVSNLIHAFLG